VWQTVQFTLYFRAKAGRACASGTMIKEDIIPKRAITRLPKRTCDEFFIIFPFHPAAFLNLWRFQSSNQFALESVNRDFFDALSAKALAMLKVVPSS